MGSTVELAVPYCLAEVAGSAVLLQSVKEVVLVDLQRLSEEAEQVGSQRSAEEAGLAGPVVVAGPWLGRAGLPNLHTVSLMGCLIEHLLHVWAKNAYHHLLEYTKEGPVMPTQHVFRGVSKRLHEILLLLQSCSVTLSRQ
jgi:hypothetical protein